jgi:hypothetical protein
MELQRLEQLLGRLDVILRIELGPTELSAGQRDIDQPLRVIERLREVLDRLVGVLLEDGDRAAVGPRLAVVGRHLDRPLELHVRLRQLLVEILAHRLGVDAGHAVRDLERRAHAAGAEDVDQTEDVVGLVVALPERDGLVGLALGRLQVLLAQRVLGDVESLVALLGVTLRVWACA